MKNHIFDGVYPIRLFEFLTRFVIEADTLSLSDTQAFVALQKFLADLAQTQLRTNLNRSSRHGGVTCWQDAILYL